MRVVKALRVWTLLVALAAAGSALAQETVSPSIEVRITVDPLEATVGDPIAVRLVVSLPPGTKMDPPRFGPALGSFAVTDESWSEAKTVDGAEQRTWSGTLVWRIRLVHGDSLQRALHSAFLPYVTQPSPAQLLKRIPKDQMISLERQSSTAAAPIKERGSHR